MSDRVTLAAAALSGMELPVSASSYRIPASGEIVPVGEAFQQAIDVRAETAVRYADAVIKKLQEPN